MTQDSNKLLLKKQHLKRPLLESYGHNPSPYPTRGGEGLVSKNVAWIGELGKGVLLGATNEIWVFKSFLLVKSVLNYN